MHDFLGLTRHLFLGRELQNHVQSGFRDEFVEIEVIPVFFSSCP